MALSLYVALMVQATPLTWRVDGPGYFRLTQEGRVVYAKTIELQLHGGKLGSVREATFLPSISYSGDLSEVDIDAKGFVTAYGPEGKVTLGQLLIAVFPEGNAPLGNQGYFTSQIRPSLHQPSAEFGVIRSGTAKAEERPAPPKTQPKPQRTESRPTVAPSKQVTSNRPVQIRFLESASIEGPEILIGMIATVEGKKELVEKIKAISLGDTPPLGVERKLDLARIRARLMAQDIDLQEVEIIMPKQITIAQIHQVATSEMLVKKAQEAAEEEYGQYGTLESDGTVSPVVMPQGTFELIAEQVTTNDKGFRVTIAAKSGNRVIQRRTVVLVRKGVPKPLRFGQSVTVFVTAQNVRVETTGRVTRVGKPGEPVEVTLTNGKRFTAHQLNDNEVEVRP